MVRTAEGRDPAPSAAVLDAQPIKSDEGGSDRGFDAGTKTTGRKRHLITAPGPVLVAAATSASVRDRPGGRRVLERLARAHPSIGLVRADAGYANRIDSSLLNRAYEKSRIIVETVRRSDDTKGVQALPRRWVVERIFGRLVRNRRLARDHKRLTGNSETVVKIAMIRLMATRLAGQSVRRSSRPADRAA